MPNGAHVVAARARDTDNKTTASTPVNVTVANTRHLPERGPRYRVRPPDGHEVPARRPAAAHGAGGQDPGPAAALYDPEPDPVPADHQHPHRRCPAGDLRPGARPQFRSQPLLLCLLHNGHARRRPPVPLHGELVAHGHRSRQRAGPLPRPAGSRHRAPRRRHHLRQRRDDLFHDRRALPGDAVAEPEQPAREDPPDLARRPRADRQPFLRRLGTALGFGVGLRTAQSVSRLLRPSHRPALRRRRRRQRGSMRGRRWTSAPAARTTAGPTSKGPAQRRAPIPSTATSTTRTTAPASRAASSTTGRSSPPGCRGTTSSPTTPGAGSSAWRSTRTATSTASSSSSRSPEQLRRRHRLPDRRARRGAVLPRPRLRRHHRHIWDQQAPPDPLSVIQPGPGGARVGGQDVRSRAARGAASRARGRTIPRASPSPTRGTSGTAACRRPRTHPTRLRARASTWFGSRSPTGRTAPSRLR